VARIKVDPSIARVSLPAHGGGDFQFPLGVYPVEDEGPGKEQALVPRQGYSVHFEQADGGPDDAPGRDESSGEDDFGPSKPGPGPGMGRGSGRGEGRSDGRAKGREAREAREERESFDPEEMPAPRGSGELEEWPDRYAFDIVVSSERLPSLCRALFMLFDTPPSGGAPGWSQGRVYPILDVLGQDAYREIDPYIAYDLVGLDVFLDGVREFHDFLYEDGMIGFGGMSEDPFLYVFVDEHKIVTVRAQPEMRERVERVLAAFDLEQTEHAAGVDAAAHEHRSVLTAPANNPEFLTPEEVVEDLVDGWRMLLNVDPDSNKDDEGNELGPTSWRALVRCEFDEAPPRYAETVFDAENFRQAEQVAFTAIEELSDAGREGGVEEEDWSDARLVIIDRITPAMLTQILENAGLVEGKPGKTKAGGKAKDGAKDGPKAPKGKTSGAGGVVPGKVYFARWLDGP
jgi:hypothetical protein